MGLGFRVLGFRGLGLRVFVVEPSYRGIMEKKMETTIS